MVNLALLNNVPFRNISERFGIGVASLKRHRDLHIPQELATAHHAEKVLQADVLLAEEEEDRALVRGKFKQLSGPQLKGTDKAFWLQCRREVRSSSGLLLKASGLWKEKQSVELSGQVATAEQEDSAAIAFIEKRHPELRGELLEYLKAIREREIRDRDS